LTTEKFDVIVIGVGSMGSATCYNLAKRGHRVLGLEQFNSPHEKGSHTGQSRIIRKAYFEHAAYVPLLNRSYDLWREFEHVSNKKLYHQTGIVYTGEPHNENIKGIISSAEQFNIPVEELSADTASKKFPQLRTPPTFKTIFEGDAGFITPDPAISQYILQAEKLGASIRQHEEVVSWDYESNQFLVKTTKSRYRAERLIVTAGSWTSKLLPQINFRLKVTEQFLFWIDVKDKERFALGNFPCWFIEDPELGTFYGFPILPNQISGPFGFKIAHHAPGESVNPDHPVKKNPIKYYDKVKRVIEKYLPEANGEINASKSCMYTYSPDSHFIIDHLPGFNDNLTIACGFSGHGFKFVSVIGEILSDLAMNGTTSHPIDFLRLSRFTGR
jgi:sarcosine oxidase